MKNQEVAWLLKEKFNGEESAGFFADCERLAAGEPLAYVIGSIPFLDCVIYLDSKPLIPRPETEFWVEKAIVAIRSSLGGGHDEAMENSVTKPLHCFTPRKDETFTPKPSILDLCAGSGAIGVAVAKAIPNAHITFAEIDDEHLTTIEKNITDNLAKPSINRRFSEVTGQEITQKPSIRMEDLSGRAFEVIGSDLFESIPKEEKFNFILSNPPYIDAKANTVDESVATFEPHLALFGGAQGLALIEKIIAQAPNYLAADGQLWIEHEPFQAVAIAALGTTHGFTVVSHTDQYQYVRYSVLMR